MRLKRLKGHMTRYMILVIVALVCSLMAINSIAAEEVELVYLLDTDLDTDAANLSADDINQTDIDQNVTEEKTFLDTLEDISTLKLIIFLIIFVVIMLILWKLLKFAVKVGFFVVIALVVIWILKKILFG